MEPEICTKMLRNLNEKLRAKFPVTTCVYNMVKIAHLDDAFSELEKELEVSPVEDQSLDKKIRKGEKERMEKKLPQDVYIHHFLVQHF